MRFRSLLSVSGLRVSGLLVVCCLCAGGPAYGAKKKKAAKAEEPPPENVMPRNLEEHGIAEVRPMKDVRIDAAADGSVTYWLRLGDSFSAEESPDLTGRGLEVEIFFHYKPELDANSTLLQQGDAVNGFVIHIMRKKPAVTVVYGGLRATLQSDIELPEGLTQLRMVIGLDGTMAFQASTMKKGIRGYAPMGNGFANKPAEGLQVGKSLGPLPLKDYPVSTPYAGTMAQVRLTLLPGVTDELRAPKAVPVQE
ncbi:hypothetical protein BH11VER1_BH11VER1_37230 [soil metagenome]